MPDPPNGAPPAIVPFRLRSALAVPAGWPPDVAPNQVIASDHINAIRASVYAWPGDVDAQTHKLKNVILENASGVVSDPTTTKGDILARGAGAVLERVGVGANGQVLTADSASAQGLKWTTPPSAVTTVFGRAGAVVAQPGDYSAAQVTGAVADPTTAKGDLMVRGAAAVVRLAAGGDGQVLVASAAAATGLAWTPVSSLPVAVQTVFGRTGAIVAAAGDYTAAQVTNAADRTQAYADPVWITAIAWGKLTGVPATFPPLAHTHAAADIVSGLIAPARLGAGVADSSVFLRGDGVWAGAGGAGAVTSVFGRVGVVAAQAGDYTVAQVTGALADVTTAKGDLLVRGASAISRLPAGASGQVLVSDSTAALGVTWAAGATIAQTPWVADIDAAGFKLGNAGGIGIGGAAAAGIGIAVAGSFPALRHISAAATEGGAVELRNDAGNTFTRAIYGSNYAIPAWRNVAVLRAVTSDIALAAGSTEIMRATAAGNVGIGNVGAVPFPGVGYNHLIVGPQAISAALGMVTACGNSVTDQTWIGLFAFANYAIGGTEKRIAHIAGVVDGAANSGALLLSTWNAGTMGERVRITKTGAVGINTVPNARLDINGIGGTAAPTLIVTAENYGSLPPTMNSNGPSRLVIQANLSNSQGELNVINANYGATGTGGIWFGQMTSPSALLTTMVIGKNGNIGMGASQGTGAILTISNSDNQLLLANAGATKAGGLVFNTATGDATQGGFVLQRRTPAGSFEANLFAVNIANGYVGMGGETRPTSPLQITNGLPIYASDAAAGSGGLTKGALFQDSAGNVHIKL